MGDYLTVEELKATLMISGTNYDSDLQNAVTAASRTVDDMTGRTFSPGPTGEERWFRPVSADYLIVGDMISITSLEVSEQPYLVDTDWYRESTDVIRPLNGMLTFPVGRRAVKVTGQWGWTTPPAEVQQATQIIATQLFKRVREAPFGIISPIDEAGIRLGRYDPQVQWLLDKYTRSSMIE
jgi:hypothetical protein